MTTLPLKECPPPEVCQVDDGVRIRWGDVYPVIRLKKPGPICELPGQSTVVDREDVLNCSDALVFGERSGGVRDFLSWWCQKLDEGNRPWVLVWGSAWDREFFKWSAHADESFRNQGNVAIQGFGQNGSATKRAKALKGWANELKESHQPCTLIIRHFAALSPSGAVEAAEALSVLREIGGNEDLRLLVADTSEHVFLSKQDISGYWRFSLAYRLAPLDDAAVQAWAARQSADWLPLSFSEQALARFMEQTGGQPLLVQDLLERLRVAVNAAEPTLEETVDSAASRMRASPPSVVHLWQADLKRILSEHPDLISPMEIYAAGRTLGPARFPPPSRELPLFIAGWVRLNREGRWGITSKLHRDLARAVLDELEG